MVWMKKLFQWSSGLSNPIKNIIMVLENKDVIQGGRPSQQR